jgi:hypothetical protein
MQNIIPIIFVPGAKGHQIGRLLASCDNVRWYDHFKNGDHPWLPAMGMDMGNISKFHFDRRFRGASGIGIDDFTIPPVLDMAERNQYSLDERQILDSWSKKISPFYCVYPLHARLDASKQLFKDSKHLVVLCSDVDKLVNRFIKTTANFVYSYADPKKKTFYQHFESLHLDIGYETWIKTYINSLLDNYKSNIQEQDYVIDDIEQLLDYDKFQDLCRHFDLTANEQNYNKVHDFVKEDSFQPTVITKKLERKDMIMLKDFCSTCDDLGYHNNNSLSAMRFSWCLEQNGSWWVTVKDHKIISISGIHPFKDGWRALFRGAQTETRPIQGLNRYQMQSYCVHSQLPLQIEYAESISGKDVPIYITTNIDNDASGSMSRVHRSFFQMEKGGMVVNCGEEEVFGVRQVVWKLDKDRYFDLRR